VFDGDCGFCTTAAKWTEKRLPQSASVTPWQSLDLQEIGLTPADTTSAAWWIDDSGRNYRGHMAIGQALKAMGDWWGAIGVLITVPPLSWLGRPAYWLVAKYRYRLPGATDACRLPDSE